MTAVEYALPSTVLAPPSIADPNPDAELIALGRTFGMLRAEVAQNDKLLDACEKQAKELAPPMPDTLRIVVSDIPLFTTRLSLNGLPEHWEKFVVGSHYGHSLVMSLRAHPFSVRYRRAAEAIDNLPRDAEFIEQSVPWPAAQERADEIVRDYDRWLAEASAIEKRIGIVELEDERDVLWSKLKELADTAVELKATTLAGMQVKARIVDWCVNGELDQEPDDDWTTDRRIAWSMMRDALACNPQHS